MCSDGVQGVGNIDLAFFSLEGIRTFAQFSKRKCEVKRNWLHTILKGMIWGLLSVITDHKGQEMFSQTCVILFTIGLVATRSMLIFVSARSVRIQLECFLVLDDRNIFWENFMLSFSLPLWFSDSRMIIDLPTPCKKHIQAYNQQGTNHGWKRL